MSIKKRTFLIVCCIISAILLTLNGATYLLFRYSIARQLITSQEAVIEANVRLSGIFTQAVDQLVYQYTSDQQLGELLSRDIGQDELQDLNTKFNLNSRLSYQLNAEALLLNNGFKTELFVNPELEVSQLFLPSNTIPNVSRVFSGATVADEDWYQAALSRRSGQHIFLSEDQTRLCFACRLQSSSFTGAHLQDGVGVLRGSLPITQLPHLLSLVPVTQHSGFLLLNDQGTQVYRSPNLSDLAITETLLIPNSVSSLLEIEGERYLCTSQELQWGLQLVFLTPYQDIQIEEIGLRPGEKLYEELLTKSADLSRTENDKIFVEFKPIIPEAALERRLAELSNVLEHGRRTDIFRTLHRLVPTFRDPEEVNRAALSRMEEAAGAAEEDEEEACPFEEKAHQHIG